MLPLSNQENTDEAGPWSTFCLISRWFEGTWCNFLQHLLSVHIVGTLVWLIQLCMQTCAVCTVVAGFLLQGIDVEISSSLQWLSSFNSCTMNLLSWTCFDEWDRGFFKIFMKRWWNIHGFFFLFLLRCRNPNVSKSAWTCVWSHFEDKKKIKC